MDKLNNSEPIVTDVAAEPARIAPSKFQPQTKRQQKARRPIRGRTVLIGTLFVICTAIAWFILTAKAVYIDTEPKTARISVDGFLQLKLADRYLLRAGDYEVDIDADGYYPIAQQLNVGGEQSQQFSFQLQRLPGHLRVDTGEVAGAQVFLDADLKGDAPLTIRDVPHGEHEVRINADRYFPFQDSVLVEGLDKEQSLVVDLLPAWADVEFASVPVGADVVVDDELVGQTPLSVQILQGKHAVRVKLAGYKVWQDDISVIASQAMSLADIKLAPADAVVFLVSEPPRANTTVDGEYQGLTPLELALSPGKQSTIRLFKQGYRPASRQVTLSSGDEQRLDVKLVAELSSVDFNVTPADAKLYINGRLRGAAKQTVQLSARTHRIEIRKEGYVDYETRVTPRAGIAQQINVTLKTLRQAKIERIKPVIKTSAGQSLKLFYPFGFTMGASRREPGRKANETLRRVELKRPFYLGLHEVTNEQYRLFEKGHASGTVKSTSLDTESQPVVQITWEQAARYCNWLSSSESLTPFYTQQGKRIVGFNAGADGYRLPTEAEWAWAARALGGSSLLKFPWGKALPPPEDSGNYADDFAAGLFAKIIRNYKDGYLVSAPVGSFPADRKGLYDLGGNVAEWVHDYYDIAIGASATPVDPLGPKNGEFHVIRGASWGHGAISELRLSFRDYDTKAREDVGFRLARYLE